MKYILITFLLSSFFLGTCQSDTVLVSHLSASWLNHDENDELTQSFGDEDNRAGGFFLIKNEMNDHILEFCGQEYNIWLEGKLIRPSASGCRYFSATDFFLDYKRDTLYFVVSAKNLSNVDVNLMSISNGSVKLFNAPIRFEKNDMRQFFLLVTILLMLFLVILRRIDNYSFTSLMNFSFLGRKLEADDPSLGATTNSILMVLLALLLAFQKTISDVSSLNLSHLLSTFFLAIGFIFVFVVAKLLLLGTVTRLFRFKKIESNQFRNYLLFFVSSFLMLFLLEVFIFWFQNSSKPANETLLLLGLIVNILFIIWMYFKLRNHHSRRKLHIISYLCSTEILPTFVLANWLLN